MKAKGETRAARLQELEEMAAGLLATAPPGQDRQEFLQEIAEIRAQIDALKAK